MAKRKRSLWRTVAITIIALLLVGLLAYFITRYVSKPAFVHYAAFGVSVPVNYSIHGIDVSKHQGNIAWQEVKGMTVNKIQIGFAFIKATEGIGRVDEQFRRNWYHARKAGIPRGAYHFFISSKSGKAQAENFLETVTLEKGDLPPVLDVEQLYGASKADVQQRVKDWLVMVESKCKIRPIIYTNADFYEHYLAGNFDDYPLWVAHYLVLEKPRVVRNWHFWQHSETGHVNGVKGYVDFNVFNGDSLAFQNLLIR
jgi:lysozyme